MTTNMLLEENEFHWKNGWTWKRLGEGAVRIRKYTHSEKWPLALEIVVPAWEWCSIISSVAPGGETKKWEAAKAFHLDQAEQR